MKTHIILFILFYTKICYSQTTLTLLNNYVISNTVEEPSGLAFDKLNNQLFTISDSNNIYRLSTTGDLLETYNFSGDLEGISTYNVPNTLLVAIEDTYEIVVYNYITGARTSHKMVYDNRNDPGSGIEGVTYNNNTGEIYFLNEKNPGALIIADNNFNVTNEHVLSYAGDYSASYYVEETNKLWLGSDNASAVYKCNTDGSVIESFDLTLDGKELDKIEGIAIDYQNQLLYLVTDGGGELLIYSITNNTLNTHLLEKNTEISVSPNPFTNQINISTNNNNLTVHITDITGKTIKKQPLKPNTTIIKDLNFLTKGVYLLQITDDSNNKIESLKIIKN